MDHGGRIVAKVLKSRGVTHLFTLSGGHLFSIYDGCREEGIGLIDVRHEQSAAFAAEGFAEGDPRSRGRGAHCGAGGDQRHQRNCQRPGERVSSVRVGRAGAGAALGGRLAAGDRSPSLRFAAGQVGGDGEGAGGDRRHDRRGARPRAHRSNGPDLRRLPARRGLHRGRAGHPRAAAVHHGAPGARRRGGGRPSRRRGAPGDHGRHRPLLGSR